MIAKVVQAAGQVTDEPQEHVNCCRLDVPPRFPSGDGVASKAQETPENDIKAQNEAALARATSEIQKEFLRTAAQPENIHAMCEDYRAGASIDLKHDEADLNKKVACPLLTLWGERGPMGRIYDVLAIWKERGTRVTGKGLPGGHNLQEDVPDQVLAEVTARLRT